MDIDTSVLQERPSERTFRGFRFLEPLQIGDPPDGNMLAALWDKVKMQEYAFDDFSRDRVDYFLCMLADQHNVYLKIGDHGLFLVLHPIEKGTAEIHFIVWDKEFSLYQRRDVVCEIYDYLFYEKKVHRVQGTVPNYNKLAQRFVLACGMRFEGEMQDAVLWKGHYYNVQIYGITEKQWAARRERFVK